jgi:hypothetical protein
MNPSTEQAIASATEELESALVLFVDFAGPVRIESDGQAIRRLRFVQEDWVQLVVVKAARVISGLNALRVLLDAGYILEAGVIIRTIDDFLDEITFLVEGTQRSEATADQKRFVEDFFAERVDPADPGERAQGVDRSKRRQIRAAKARLISPDNPDRLRKLSATIDFAWDGYVHGAYHQGMDLLATAGRHPSFRTRGVDDDRVLASYREHLLRYTHMALNVFSTLAAVLDLPAPRARLAASRTALELAQMNWTGESPQPRMPDTTSDSE